MEKGIGRRGVDLVVWQHPVVVATGEQPGPARALAILLRDSAVFSALSCFLMVWHEEELLNVWPGFLFTLAMFVVGVDPCVIRLPFA